jgi:hypothetical protein
VHALGVLKDPLGLDPHLVVADVASALSELTARTLIFGSRNAG